MFQEIKAIFVDNCTSKETQLLFNYAQEFFYMQEPEESKTRLQQSHRDQQIYFDISLICYILITIV